VSPPSSSHAAVFIESLAYRYGDRTAIESLSLAVPAGEIFGFLGPNGSGKTTLFRILSTLIPQQAGRVEVLGMKLPEQREAVRQSIGVVFQSPSLDRHLTAEENLRHHGHLYGIRGAELSQRIAELLARFDLSDRAGERVERFSGGMRRRVELAKGLLHRPRLLLLDEPSTGLDPRARLELMQQLRQVQIHEKASVLMTTHLMEEAEQCDRLAIMDRGRLVACDTPAALMSQIGGDVITLSVREEPQAVADCLRQNLSLSPTVADGAIRLEHRNGAELLPAILRACPDVQSISVGKPTLMDVFVRLTGRTFAAEDESPAVLLARH
jgi:ABC-2 type transport system ATP-binding protein